MNNVTRALFAQIEQFLTADFESPLKVNDHEYQITAGSSVCRVSVAESSSGRPLIFVLAFILGDVPASADLYEYVALHADDWVFGHLCAARDDASGTLVLSLRHTLLGESLDRVELVEAVKALSATANELDDSLRRRFGGVRWID